MVVRRTCSFCAGDIEPGTGFMFVKRDGTVFFFDSSSCRKQQLHLGRVGHRLRWTHAHELKRLAEQRRPPSAAPAVAPALATRRPTGAKRPAAAVEAAGSPKPTAGPTPPKAVAKPKPKRAPASEPPAPGPTKKPASPARAEPREPSKGGKKRRAKSSGSGRKEAE